MNKLTNEQLTELKNFKSIDELKVFLTKENITFTDEEMVKASKYFESGKSELTDDELNLVAGGGDKEDDYKRQAYADGRKVPVPGTTFFCDCFIEQVWAETYRRKPNGQGTIDSEGNLIPYTTFDDEYLNAKCYGCGLVKESHVVS